MIMIMTKVAYVTKNYYNKISKEVPSHTKVKQKRTRKEKHFHSPLTVFENGQKKLQFSNFQSLNFFAYFVPFSNLKYYCFYEYSNKCVLFQLFAYCTGFLYSDDV